LSKPVDTKVSLAEQKRKAEQKKAEKAKAAEEKKKAKKAAEIIGKKYAEKKQKAQQTCSNSCPPGQPSKLEGLSGAGVNAAIKAATQQCVADCMAKAGY